MSTPIVSETHKREVHMKLTWEELKALLVQHLIKASGSYKMGDDVVDVKIAQLTEGSPSYSVQKWEASIRLTQDLGPKTEEYRG